MKNLLKSIAVVAVFAITSTVSYGQSNSLKGKAMSAANDCMQGFDYHGLGLQIVTQVNESGSCGDGFSYSVDIMAIGHCPGGKDILCLVIGFPIATVYFDCSEEVSGVVCFNN